MVGGEESWFAEIGDAERIELELWTAYEARFQAAHEQSLAYRYLPSTPEEIAHVERFFPVREVLNKEGRPALHVDFEKLSFAEWERAVPFSSIHGLKVDDGILGKVLVISALDDAGKKQNHKISLKTLAMSNEQVLDLIGTYYGRHQVAKQHATQS